MCNMLDHSAQGRPGFAQSAGRPGKVCLAWQSGHLWRARLCVAGNSRSATKSVCWSSSGVSSIKKNRLTFLPFEWETPELDHPTDFVAEHEMLASQGRAGQEWAEFQVKRTFCGRPIFRMKSGRLCAEWPSSATLGSELCHSTQILLNLVN